MGTAKRVQLRFDPEGFFMCVETRTVMMMKPDLDLKLEALHVPFNELFKEFRAMIRKFKKKGYCVIHRGKPIEKRRRKTA